MGTDGTTATADNINLVNIAFKLNMFIQEFTDKNIISGSAKKPKLLKHEVADIGEMFKKQRERRKIKFQIGDTVFADRTKEGWTKGKITKHVQNLKRDVTLYTVKFDGVGVID